MACGLCGKSERARWYCRRADCGLSPVALTSAAGSARYNEALGQLKIAAQAMMRMADAAYAVAENETAPGPRERLMRIADLASDFATLVKIAEPL